MRRVLAILVGVLVVSSPAGLRAQDADFVTARFGRYLDALRRQTGIPGLSGAILRNGSVIWETGLGLQDIERSIPATPDTPFYLGDLTQVFTATMVLQCIEQGRLSFDDLVSIPRADQLIEFATVRQLLIHDGATPDGPPFAYNPERFAALASAVERCANIPAPLPGVARITFREQLVTTLLDRLGMARTLPGLDAATLVPTPFAAERAAAYAALTAEIATPYSVDDTAHASVSALPPGALNGAAGIVSTVRDLARFDAALDSLVLLQHETLVNAWTPRAPFEGRPRPFGHGWFTELNQNEPIVWHFGYTPNVGSALWIKLPARSTTLILLANSDRLSAQFSLANGDVTTSPFARLFLSLFR